MKAATPEMGAATVLRHEEHQQDKPLRKSRNRRPFWDLPLDKGEGQVRDRRADFNIWLADRQRARRAS